MPNPTLKRLPAVFYATAQGKEPVREWLLALAPEDRRTVGQDIATAEFGWQMGMPICRKLGQDLWEIRSTISRGRIARVLFTVADGQMVLLHGFVKKSQKTPKSDIDLAVKRKKDITS